MSERTETYGFTKEKMLHLLGPGTDFKAQSMTDEEATKAKRKTLKPIDCVGDNKGVAIFYLEFISTVPHNHWWSKVNIPEGATASTKLWAEIELSEDAMALADKLIQQLGLPTPASLAPANTQPVADIGANSGVTKKKGRAKRK